MTSGFNGELLLFLVMAVILFAGFARYLKVPYPILLMLAGVGLSLVPHVPRFALPPALVFSVFLPPLLYSAAWTLSWREFQRNATLIAMLAFGLVIVTIVTLMAAAGRWLPGFTWQSALLLGAVVAATDAIAATSVARRLLLPHHLVALLEAESLVNDGTALVALQFGLSILLTGNTPGVVDSVMELLFLTGGGVAVGLVVAIPIAWLERMIDDGPIEIIISVLVPYLAYLAGEHAHVSSVIAVIACGMYMSRQSYAFMTAQVRLQATAVWDALTFLLNGLIFVSLGLQLPFVLDQVRVDHGSSIWIYGALFSIALIALRMVWIFIERNISSRLYSWFTGVPSDTPDAKHLTVIGWGGMRGVLSLAAAESLPLSTPSGAFKERSLIIFLSFCLIGSTLIFQGLTFPFLIRRLGLAGQADLKLEERETRRTMLREALGHLSRRRSRDRYHSSMLKELIRSYQHRLDSLPAEAEESVSATTDGAARRDAILDVLQVERATLLRLRDEGQVDDEVLRTLQRELDLAESRVHTSIA